MNRYSLAALLALCALPCAAQQLQDPTKPPAEATPAPVGPGGPVVAAGPQLQSVLIGSRGRQVAVIDGQTVRQGERVGDAVLVRVGKNEAVLRRGKTLQVLTLFPAAAADGKTAAPR